MILATSSLQGAIATITIVGYLIAGCILLTGALFVYVLIATYLIGEQNASKHASRTKTSVNASGPVPRIHAGPGASSPELGSPEGARRSMS